MNSFKRVRELEVLILRRGENRSIRWKTSRGKEENQRQTQPTRGFDAVISTRAHSRPQSPSFLGRLQIKPSGSGDENESGPHCREASALTTAPPILPTIVYIY